MLMFSMQGLINGVNRGLVGMYCGANEMWVEVTCIYYMSPLPLLLVTTLVGLLFVLVVVFTLHIFGRVKPLNHLPSYRFRLTSMSLLSILDFTLVMKYFFLSCVGFCLSQVLQMFGILVLNGKWMVLLIIVLSSSELVVFLGDIFLLPLCFVKGF
jgi:hypothetical protein